MSLNLPPNPGRTSPGETPDLTDARVILLDADGVLRQHPDGARLDGLEAFEAFLREPEFRDVLVIAAGEWKRVLPVGRIRSLFSEDLGGRIAGATPDIEHSDEYATHVEMYEWLCAHPQIAGYVVLESSGFAPHSPVMECGVFVPCEEVFSAMTHAMLAQVLRTVPRKGAVQ
jgi:hypothetical protein